MDPGVLMGGAVVLHDVQIRAGMGGDDLAGADVTTGIPGCGGLTVSS